VQDSPREQWTNPELTELSVKLDTAAAGGSATDGQTGNPGNKKIG